MQDQFELLGLTPTDKMERNNEPVDLKQLRRALKERDQKLHKLELKLEDLEAQIAANHTTIENSKNSRLRRNS